MCVYIYIYIYTRAYTCMLCVYIIYTHTACICRTDIRKTSSQSDGSGNPRLDIDNVNELDLWPVELGSLQILSSGFLAFRSFLSFCGFLGFHRFSYVFRWFFLGLRMSRGCFGVFGGVSGRCLGVFGEVFKSTNEGKL